MIDFLVKKFTGQFVISRRKRVKQVLQYPEGSRTLRTRLNFGFFISVIQGTESGVEILVNEPYTNGPGGSGQFTHKVYHVGSHLPGWFKSLLPKSALTVEEEAWNAYPYTKTRFKCPFVEK